jgi:hypothetical protein
MRTALPVLFAMPWLATQTAFADPSEIADIKWIHGDADLIAELTVIRAECAMATSDPERTHAVRLGRVAFRSPALLGGLAARVGMSCNSCHPNGHANNAFFVVGVSGKPGTADVTGSVFSTVRDDHIFNPVPIPSLLDSSARPSFGSVAPVADLPTFLNAAIVDEFQGQPPSASIAEALLAYVTSLQSSACRAPASIPVSFESDAQELHETLDLILASLDRDDPRTARFVLLSLRAALGRVYHRFPESIGAREELIELSMSLSDVRRLLESEGEDTQARSILASVQKRLEVSIQKLESAVSDSFYDASTLRTALGSGG